MTNNHSYKEFAELQFKELRNEILGIKERIIKLQLIGVSGIPIIMGAGEKIDLTAVLMASPLITLVLAFMLIFEQGSLMRAGEYIKNIVEPVLTENKFVGWECWLQQDAIRRRAETFFAWSVHIAFAVYFALGTWLAYVAISEKINNVAAIGGLGFYCGGFLLAIYLIVTNFRVGTDVAKPCIQANQTNSADR